MTLVKVELKIPVEQDNTSDYTGSARAKLALAENDVKLVKILRKSLDMSDKEQFYYNIEVAVNIPDSAAQKKACLFISNKQTSLSMPKA